MQRINPFITKEECEKLSGSFPENSTFSEGICFLPKGNDTFFISKFNDEADINSKNNKLREAAIIHLDSEFGLHEDPKKLEREIKRLNFDDFGITPREIIEGIEAKHEEGRYYP